MKRFGHVLIVLILQGVIASDYVVYAASNEKSAEISIKDEAKSKEKGTKKPRKAARQAEYMKEIEAAYSEVPQNDGVLNGPLACQNLGHRAKGQGDAESLKLAIEDLMQTYGSKYSGGENFPARLDGVTNNITSPEFLNLKKEALLANPVLDFNAILMVRSRNGRRFSNNWETQASLGRGMNYDDELVLMSPVCNGAVKVLYKPPAGRFIGDLDLHYDQTKILFTSQNESGRWNVYELEIDVQKQAVKGPPVQVTPEMGEDIDNYDACYLPDDRIIFASTAAYEGVPCVGGGAHVANLYLLDKDRKTVRRLCFDQDGNWHPAVMENGRIMYTRWEYTDMGHYFSRILMTMNPDGTDQKAFYGSNSYWPNSMFFARPIPGKPDMFISTVTGHHSNPKGGALCLFDVSKGRNEADGAVQFITGRGKTVHPLVIDNLSKAYAPMFYYPYPLNDKYFLAVTGRSVYLLDVFDNMLCLTPDEVNTGDCYYEPLPFRTTAKPDVRPDRVRLDEKTANVLISDIYEGPGLEGVPRGTVRNIRVLQYEYGPRNTGGHYAMGMESGWDVKQVLGNVKVEDDGSANFLIPANTPVSLQPVDEEGKALQLMRSWLVGMPGENLSCVGCHESQNTTPPLRRTKAMVRVADDIKPFYGPVRGFSFKREILPIIHKNCSGCHDGTPNLSSLEKMNVKVDDRVTGTGPNTGRKFSECGIPNFSSSPIYTHEMIHPYVRRNGPEGDNHLLTPLEFHADTSELVQMLKKGHHNVQLTLDEWNRLYTWIDFNAPFHGTWTEAGANTNILNRRMELREKYAFVDDNPEKIEKDYTDKVEFVPPAPSQQKPPLELQKPEIRGPGPAAAEIDLGDGVIMKLAGIPAGEFGMGSSDETLDEQPVDRVRISKPFMMGSTEVTLRQYRKFDPEYLNGVYDMHYKDQVKRGYYMDNMEYPVIRVSWQDAMEFCKWLSEQTGRKVNLPTEAQWEWACKAGTSTPLSYGTIDTDFAQYANFADKTVVKMAVSGVNPNPIASPDWRYDFELKDPRFSDNVLHLAKVASFQPNAWGLYDMHGNAAEWTRSEYKPYPYKEDANNERSGVKRVVRGGSWHDRPFRSTSTYRLGYPDWQRVYHTGFRVVVEE